MIKKIFFKAFLPVILLIGMASCKQGPVGPQGSTGAQGANGEQGTDGTLPEALQVKEDGFINFTISGNRTDGTPFSYTESFKTCRKSVTGTCQALISSMVGNQFSLRRYKDATSVLFSSDNYLTLMIRCDLNGAVIPNNSTIQFRVTEPISSTQRFQLYGVASSSDPRTFILNYDSNTHKVTGAFSATVLSTHSSNTTGHDIIINGTYESSVVEYSSKPAE